MRFVSGSIKLLLAVLALVAISSCTSHWAETDPIDAVRPVKVDGEALFGYRKAPIDARESVIETNGDYDVVRVSFPSYFQDDPSNRLMTALYFRQKSPGPKPSIIVLPILGGDYGPTLMFARFYAARGFNVLHFERKNGVFEAAEEGLKRAREVLIASIVDQRRGLDWWLTKPEVDPKRIGVCGISMGGFQASLLMAVENRINAGVFLLNGCDFAELLFVSKEPSVIEYIDDMVKKTGMTRDALRAEAQKQLADIDPKVFAPNLDPARVLTISARFDQVVPYYMSTRWWEAAGRPNRTVVPTGHYSAIFIVHHAEQQSLDHFNKVFGIGKY
jgi:dienelactone hydrolase